VAAFAQLAVAGRGSNTCVYVIAILTMCESTENASALSFVLKLKKPQRKRINYCSKHTVKMQWVVHKCLTGSVDLKRVEPPLKATPARDDRQHRQTSAKVRTIVRNNRRLTVREIADDCGISVGSCDAILTDDLHMKRVCAKFVPRLLTDDQREQRQTIARDLFERSCIDVRFLKIIVTGDESKVYGYDPETKQQSSQWKGPTSPRPK